MKSKILKEKRISGGIIKIIDNEGYFCLVFYKDKYPFKVKTYIKSEMPKLNKQILFYVKREFRSWLKLYWKYGYIENDDTQTLDKKEVI